MLSNTQPSTSALVSIILNELLGPTPLEGGQSCLGVWGQETVNLRGWQVGCRGKCMCSSHVLSTWQSRGAHRGVSYLFCNWHSILVTKKHIHLWYTCIRTKLRTGLWVPFRMAFMPLQLQFSWHFSNCLYLCIVVWREVNCSVGYKNTQNQHSQKEVSINIQSVPVNSTTGNTITRLIQPLVIQQTCIIRPFPLHSFHWLHMLKPTLNSTACQNRRKICIYLADLIGPDCTEDYRPKKRKSDQ